MACLFPFHKLILEEGEPWMSQWKEAVKQTSIQGPTIAQMASNLEILSSIFNREKSLLGRLLYSKNNQLKTSGYWQGTRQLNSRARALRIDGLAQILQFLHLELTGQPTKKLNKPSSLCWVLPLAQIRSTQWICTESCRIIVVTYAEYRGMVEMAHFMPILLTLMAVLSRLYILFSRIESICTHTYNLITQHLATSPEQRTCSELQTWEEWVGPLPASLESSALLVWKDTDHPVSVNNQKALDALNRALQTTSNDDLGEELDFSSEIPQNLIYVPPAPTSVSKPTATSKAPHSTPSPTTTTSKPKVVDLRESKKSPAPSPAPTSSHKDSKPPSSKEKRLEISKDKKKEKTKDKQELDDLFGLLKSPNSTSSSSTPKISKDKRPKDTPKTSSSPESSSKKRKKSTDEDEIDDLFSLISAPKKPKT